MKIAICDDEVIFLSRLRELLVQDSIQKGYDITVTEYHSGEELLQAYQKGLQIDILFLDIRMDRTDGMEAAKTLRKMGCQCLLIFLTSLVEYMQKGYEVRAFRYLLKEQTVRELGKVMDSCRQELSTQDYFNFSYERKNYSIRISDISYFESQKRLIYLYTTQEQYRFYEKMDALEKQLQNAGFIRCHRSFLVSERQVLEWNDTSLRLAGGMTLPISRTYAKEVNRRLMLRMGEM